MGKTLGPVLKQGDGTEVEKNGGLMKVSVTVVGITPLLMNAMTEAQLLAIRDKTKAAKNAQRPALRDEAAQKVHALNDGRPCIPITMLMSCLIGAGQFVRLDGRRQISTASSTVLPGLMNIESLELPLVAGDGAAQWEVDIQQGRNPNGGEAVAVVRPRFDHWQFTVDLLVDQKEVAISKIRELFDVAGRRCGLGDFRPKRKGIFGQFKVNEWTLAEV